MIGLEEKIFQVFKDVLALPSDIPRETIIYNSFPGWDSVAHMSIIAGLESAFDCMLDMQEILDMSSFNNSLEIMRKYGG